MGFYADSLFLKVIPRDRSGCRKGLNGKKERQSKNNYALSHSGKLGIHLARYLGGTRWEVFIYCP